MSTVDCSDYMRQGRFRHKDGDIEFDFATVDGIGLPPFPPSRTPGGYPKRIREIQNLECRSDDILLATYPKCGTHWTNEILRMLLSGKSEYAKESKMGGMLEALADLNLIERLRSPRILNTHLPYKWFPKSLVKNGGKIIHTTRNPKDTYVSYFYHASSGLELGRNTKGMTWSQFFDTCIIGKNITLGTWFDYTKEIHQAKKYNKNIHTVCFEKLKTNPEQEIKALAMFLDVKASDTLIEEIATKCEFQNLKKADSVKELPPELMKMAAERMKSDPGFKIPTIYRKGIVGDWKNHFTAEQSKQFDALFEEEMKGTDIEVIF